MPYSRDDFVRLQTHLGIWALDEYVQMLEKELPRLIEVERERIWRDVKAGDEEATYCAELAEQRLDEGITTRLLTGAAIVAIWATYELVVKRVAERMRASRNLAERIDDEPYRRVTS
jgi:hypothetical protein